MDRKDELHEEYAKKAFSLGRLWGEIAARHYSDEPDSYGFEGSYSEIGRQMLSNRSVDSYCWWSDDCGDLPTPEQLMEWYHIDKRTGKMPLYSFRSGFINSFIEYMELYSS